MGFNKLNIAVIFGGVSSEHEVSLVSAANVISILDETKYNIHKLGITKDGRWMLTEASAEAIREDKWQCHAANKGAIISPDRGVGGILTDDMERIKIDVVFPVLHGKNGEDGAAAALCAMAAIPQVTTGMTSAAVCMDKVLTKLVCANNSIPQAPWKYFTAYEIEKDMTAVVTAVEEAFNYPFFVKPSRAGSSVGINKCKNTEQLRAALVLAAEHDYKVIVERAITGHEIEVAVIGNSEPVASVCGQIVPAEEFYSYNAKYNDDNSGLFIPANIPIQVAMQVRRLALEVYNATQCKGMARVDFFVSCEGEVIFNEINTIPGFTDISMYPKLMSEMGLCGSLLADKLIELALKADERM